MFKAFWKFFFLYDYLCFPEFCPPGAEFHTSLSEPFAMSSETEAKKVVRLSRDIHMPLYIQGKSRTKVSQTTATRQNLCTKVLVVWV
jgi:hypothetical protein